MIFIRIPVSNTQHIMLLYDTMVSYDNYTYFYKTILVLLILTIVIRSPKYSYFSFNSLLNCVFYLQIYKRLIYLYFIHTYLFI